MNLDLALIGPGTELYCAAERWADADGFPVGGVIVATFDDRDQDTGEILRRFRCLDPSRAGRNPLAAPLLRESDVDPETIRPASRQKLSYCIRRLNTWVLRGRDAERRAPKNGALSPEEVEWCHWIGVLANELGAR